MRHSTPGLTLAGIAALLLVACSSGGGGSGSSSSSGGAANTPPVANAGANQTVSSGASVTLNGTASSDADGSIASFAWTQTAGTAVTLTNAATSQPTFPAPTVAAATTLTFSLIVTDNLGSASVAATVTVTVNPAAAGNTNVTGNITFARVPFATDAQDPNRGLWYAGPVQQPARGVIVRALNASTQAVLATASTDDLGNYSLSVASNTNINIQVVARMLRDNTQALPRWDVRVQDGDTGNNPYTYIDPMSFNSSAGTAHNVAIPTGISAAGGAPGARPSGPFAVLDTIYQGIQTIRGVAPTTNFPALIVSWGNVNNSTFFSSGPTQYIELTSNLAADTDEFDQHVIAHEFGHYIEHNFSRADNIGGAHGRGDKLDPRVAFGEGFGYAFAGIVLNDPVARDSGNDNGDFWSGNFNVETNPPTSMVGAPFDDYGCWCSESSVYSILWDLYDSAADANDGIAMGFAPMWEVLIGAQRITPAYTTIFSFISALKTARPADAGAINTLVSAQNIDATSIDAFATGETHVPTNVSAADVLPLYTTITASGTPVVVRNVNDAGIYNKVGNHRFLRFTPTSSGSITVTLNSSNPNSPDPDFRMQRAGTFLLIEEDPPPQPETGSVSVTNGTTYILDVYDCANGCGNNQGTTPGDFNLTVTIN